MAKRVSEKDVAKLNESATRPNKPSFDFNPSTGKPNIEKGETVLIAKEKDGVPVYVTNQGRVIFVCSIETYEEKFHALIKRNIFEYYYPQATKAVKNFKVDESLAGEAAAPDDDDDDKKPGAGEGDKKSGDDDDK